jgi:heavy metal sensor kinase
MPSSIRARLTLWYVAILAAILSVSALIVYTMLAQSRLDRLEARLELAARVFAASLEHEIEEHEGVGPGEESFRKVIELTHRITFPDLSLKVVRNGQLVGEMMEEAVSAIPETAIAKAAADTTDKRKPLIWSIGGRRYVALREDIRRSGEYLFVGSSSERQADLENLSIRNAILFGLPVPLMLAAVGGWWMARKSFRPVHAMIDSVEGISAKVLERRLPMPTSDNELARLAGTFNDLLGRLENSFQLQRQFMADASHELRTPVSIAHTAAQVTLGVRHREEAEYRETLEVIDAQMRRLARVVQDMFLLAHADTDVAPLQISKFYLDEVLADCVRAAKVLAKSKGITVERAESSEALCAGDESLLRQAVMILLDNAIKYSGEGTAVRVELACAVAGFYDVTVSDNGPGIPDEIQSRIFERFFRMDKARSRESGNSGGAGLGLPIARWIASVHGGSLELVKGGPTKGASFRLRISSGEI